MSYSIEPKYNNNYNLNFMRHVGYTDDHNECLVHLFSDDNITKIQNKITELLIGLLPNNRKIVVPKQTISSVLSDIYENRSPPEGDIYTKYNIPIDTPLSFTQYLEDQAISIIIADVRNNLGMIMCNSKLTAWTQVYGDFNEHGLRSHPPIKIRNRRPNPMEFFSNY